jgi:hypothetical protein
VSAKRASRSNTKGIRQSVAMQLSLAHSAAERAKNLTLEAVCVEGFE